ncbi:MAG TPA: glycosyltransferase family 2 protein [Candidatus Paceibacterota bacterium]
MVKPLLKLDIVITIFNQEEIVEKVLYGIFRNTTTPFNLILVFDGCTDRTKLRALKYLRKAKPSLLQELIVRDTPNLFELRANNFGFKLARTDYLITVQDDMIIREYGWERRLTYPLRKFDDVLAVTARVAEDIDKIGFDMQKQINQMGRELNTLPRNIFAVRDVINRGPIAFRTDYLREIGYLNDKYAPGALDDAEISLRAWLQKKWKVGAYWIDYYSNQAWSKVNAKDSTMNAWEFHKKNKARIYEDFREYLDSRIKHDENIKIEEKEVDYIDNKTIGIWKYPLRLDKRAWGYWWRTKKDRIRKKLKKL